MLRSISAACRTALIAGFVFVACGPTRPDKPGGNNPHPHRDAGAGANDAGVNDGALSNDASLNDGATNHDAAADGTTDGAREAGNLHDASSDAGTDTGIPDGDAPDAADATDARNSSDAGSIPTCTVGGVTEPITAPCIWDLVNPCLPELDHCFTQEVSGSISGSAVCDPESGWSWARGGSGLAQGTGYVMNGQTCIRSQTGYVVFGPFWEDFYDGAGRLVAHVDIVAGGGGKTITCADGSVYGFTNSCSLPTDRCRTKEPGFCFDPP